VRRRVWYVRQDTKDAGPTSAGDNSINALRAALFTRVLCVLCVLFVFWDGYFGQASAAQPQASSQYRGCLGLAVSRLDGPGTAAYLYLYRNTHLASEYRPSHRNINPSKPVTDPLPSANPFIYPHSTPSPPSTSHDTTTFIPAGILDSHTSRLPVIYDQYEASILHPRPGKADTGGQERRAVPYDALSGTRYVPSGP
jgi:hypothetical protein